LCSCTASKTICKWYGAQDNAFTVEFIDNCRRPSVLKDYLVDQGVLNLEDKRTLKEYRILCKAIVMEAEGAVGVVQDRPAAVVVAQDGAAVVADDEVVVRNRKRQRHSGDDSDGSECKK
jgi:hypothetical protein